MGFDSKGLDDYIDVAQRIAEFRVKHPEGSLQPLNPERPFEIRELAGTDKNGKEVRGTFVIYTAAAYRSPDDPRPGVGCAYEVFPGRTPYTSGSELQNAETAAWGRAIVAALAADTRAGVASQQEVRNRQAERGDPASGQSAGDVFDQSAPAPPRQNGSNGQQPGQWLAAALKQAPRHATIEACTVVWNKSAEMVKAGEVTKADAAKLQGLLRKRIEELKTAPPAAADLDPDDPWADKVADIANDSEGEAVVAEAGELLGKGEIDGARYERIGSAVEARLARISQKAAA